MAEVELTFKDGEDLDTLREQGVGLIRLFHAEIQPQKVMAVEFPFSSSIPDLDGENMLPVKLVGVWDLIETDEDGTYVIGELKTAAQRFSSIRLEYDTHHSNMTALSWSRLGRYGEFGLAAILGIWHVRALGYASLWPPENKSTSTISHSGSGKMYPKVLSKQKRV